MEQSVQSGRRRFNFLKRMTGMKLTGVALAGLILLGNVPAMAAETSHNHQDIPAWHQANHYYNLANDLFKKGQLAEAIAQYKLAITTYPHDPFYHHNLGVAHMHLGQYADSEHHLVKATQLNHKLLQSWDTLGHVYFKQQKYESALNAYQQALALNPDPLHHDAIQANITKIKQVIPAHAPNHPPHHHQ